MNVTPSSPMTAPVGEGADATVNNNIIVRCAMGVGIKDSAHAKVTRSTFYGNNYAVKCYQKVPGLGGGYAEINNCIIAGCRVKQTCRVSRNSRVLAGTVSTVLELLHLAAQHLAASCRAPHMAPALTLIRRR